MESGGVLDDNGTVNVESGGNLAIESFGVMTVESGGVLNDSGTVGIDGGATLDNSGVINVESGGVTGAPVYGRRTFKAVVRAKMGRGKRAARLSRPYACCWPCR